MCRTSACASSERPLVAAIVTAVMVLAVAACSGSGGSSGSGATTTAATPTTTVQASTSTTAVPRPPGPKADISEEITGRKAPFMGAASDPGLAAAHYVEHEYVASGTATSYKANGALGRDGRWSFEPGGTAPYRTRVLIRRPADDAKLSGTVVVEWLNVSGGVDANPDYTSLQEEILRKGDVWVGVSAQLIGVEGGPVLVTAPGAEAFVGKGLKKLDPERYGSLHHPGDGYSFDIFTQVARAVRAEASTKRVLAVGESQSAIALTTYYDGVQPLTHAFDGFLVHSRASVALPLVGPGKYADLAGSIANSPVTFRTDLDVPVLELQAETDVTGVLKSAEVRQPDSDRFRLWEVAGTAHADVHLMGSLAKSLDCGAPVNDGPMHIVAKAALRHLDAWVRDGTLPPIAPRLEVSTGTTPEVQRDADGIALGGIRTPPVDVPALVLSGVPGSNPDLLCLLLGSTKPLPPARLAALYPSRAAYVERYTAAVDRAVRAGFVLSDDVAALVGYERPGQIKG